MIKQHIFGKLEPTVTDAVTLKTRRRIYDAVDDVKLFTVVSHKNWDDGIIEVDYVSAQPITEDAPLDFINRLNDMIGQVGVTELGLTGEITITVTGAEPVIYRVIVENGELRYMKADVFNWEEPVKPSRKREVSI
jgi:hypothetical protein